MSGERDLDTLQRHMAPTLHPETFVYCSFPDFRLPPGLEPICTFREAEGLTAIVETPVVPKAWAIDAPLDEPALARGLFIKRLPAEQGGPAYLFIAQRVAWLPDNLLGKLGFDFGLLDGVRDRSKLTERECFYQLLAAVRRAEPGEIEKAARTAIANSKAKFEKVVNDPDLAPRDRAALRAAHKKTAPTMTVGAAS